MTAGPSAEPALLVVAHEADLRRAWEEGRLGLTLVALIERLRAALCPEWRPATPIAARIALSDVLSSEAESDPVLGRIAGAGGRAWSDLVASVEAAIVEARGLGWGGAEDAGTASRAGVDPLGRIALLASRKLDLALGERGLFAPGTEEERLAAALARAAPGEVAQAIGAARLTASGITSWPPRRLAFWRALDACLSRAGGSATIELGAFERPLDTTRARDPLDRLLDAVAEGLDQPPEVKPLRPVLGDLSFTGGLGADACAGIEVRVADGPGGQGRAVADAVREALARGATADRVAVVLPAGSPALAPIVRVLSEMGIPSHAAAASRGGGLLSCALRVLDLATRPSHRLELAEILRSPCLELRGVEAARARPVARGTRAAAGREAARPLMRAEPVVDILARLLETTPALSRSGAGDTLRAAIGAMQASAPADLHAAEAALLETLASHFDRAARPATRAEHGRTARDLLGALGLVDRSASRLAAALAKDRPTSAERLAREAYLRDARDAAALEQALADYEAAAAVAPASRVPFDAFRFELLGELAREDGGSEAAAAGAVRIATLGDLPLRPLDVLVLADMHASALDGAAGGGALEADTRASLTELLEPALRPSARTAEDASTVRLAHAASGARRVVVTFGDRDSEGSELAPHRLVSWLTSLGVGVSTWPSRVIHDKPITEHESLLAHLSSRGAEGDLAHASAAIRAATEAAREASFGVRASASAEPAWAEQGDLAAIVTQETGGGGVPMSVTSLDRFGSCAFRGFAAQVLGARAPRTQEDLLDPQAEGTLLHAALAAAFSATAGLWSARPRDADRIRREAAAAARAVLEREGASQGLRRTAMEEVADYVARAVAWSLSDESWDFAAAEARFGEGESSGPVVVLHGEGEELALRGSIDRIDRRHDRAALRVIDYKRSEAGARGMTEALGETSFQLAVYARAAEAMLGAPVADGVYLPVRRLQADYRPKDQGASWAQAHAGAGEDVRFALQAIRLIRTVRGGRVEPRPSDPGVCRFCDLDGVCRKPRFVIDSSADDGGA